MKFDFWIWLRLSYIVSPCLVVVKLEYFVGFSNMGRLPLLLGWRFAYIFFLFFFNDSDRLISVSSLRNKNEQWLSLILRYCFLVRCFWKWAGGSFWISFCCLIAVFGSTAGFSFYWGERYLKLSYGPLLILTSISELQLREKERFEDEAIVGCFLSKKGQVSWVSES